jgi:hypothetical protein
MPLYPKIHHRNKVWARLSSALSSAMWQDYNPESEQAVLSLKDLDKLGMINMTLDGQNLSSSLQDTLNTSMHE